MVQAYVPHEGNLWESMREAVGAFLHDAEAEAEPPELAADGDRFFLELSRQDGPAARRERSSALRSRPRACWASASARCTCCWPAPTRPTPTSRPSPCRPSTYARCTSRCAAASTTPSSCSRTRASSLPPRDQEAARVVLEAAPRVDALLGRLRELKIDGQRIRVHGDLHLGQVLDTGNDVVIIDFEGDTGRPLSERRLKRPALTDLASLVRSFHFAAHWPRVERELLSADGGRARRPGRVVDLLVPVDVRGLHPRLPRGHRGYRLQPRRRRRPGRCSSSACWSRAPATS